MKRFAIFLFSFLIVCSLSLPAFASGVGEEAGEEESISEPVIIAPVQDPGIYLGSDVSVYAANDPESSDLKSVLQQFLGDWETVVVSHNYQMSDGSIQTVNETVPDYPWLCSAGLLCLMIFCLFRLGGSILCKA